jgi:hypothetical protein
MKSVTICLAALLMLPAAAAAQTRLPAPQRPPIVPDDAPTISLRPYALATGQAFDAKQTFEAAFGRSFQPFWGGGLQIAHHGGLFVDLSASIFKKTGERTVVLNGQTYHLGIPLTVTEVPLELTAGYRFRLRSTPDIRPYVGGGVGYYRYTESSSFSAAGDDVDAQHAGGLAVAGVEFRMGRLVGLTGDVQYTYVPGILGSGGNSGCPLPSGAVCAGTPRENDLGGIAARVRFIVGR